MLHSTIEYGKNKHTNFWVFLNTHDALDGHSTETFQVVLCQHASVTVLIVWTAATCINNWWCPSELLSKSVALIVLRPVEGECLIMMLWLSFLSLFRVASRLHYVFGVAKSQAVSWAHFHMARTSRVKPMSLGFSSPRISRCFIMAMNSLLLSSPFPEDRQMGERDEGQGRDDEIIVEEQQHRTSIYCSFPSIRETYSPSQSNRANTTSHTWSESSTLATVRATCFMVTERQREESTDSPFRGLSNRTRIINGPDGEHSVCVSQADCDQW